MIRQTEKLTIMNWLLIHWHLNAAGGRLVRNRAQGDTHTDRHDEERCSKRPPRRACCFAMSRARPPTGTGASGAPVRDRVR